VTLTRGREKASRQRGSGHERKPLKRVVVATLALFVLFVGILGAVIVGPGPGPSSSTSSPPSSTSSSAVTLSASGATSATSAGPFTLPLSCRSVGGLPDPACTPGATNLDVTQANIQSTICVSGYTATIRPPTSYTDNLKQQSIQLYGYSDTNPSDYEEDHLIALEVGGSPMSVMNLWAEPHYGTYTSTQKDGFENFLHSQVCSGQMTLAEAQHEVATNWVQYWTASKGISTTASSSSATSSTAGQIAATIGFGRNPIARGGTQVITVTASDQNGPLQGVAVSVHVVYASGSTTKDLPCTMVSGTCSVSWTIGPTSNPGTFTVTVTIQGAVFDSSFQVTA